MSQSAKVVLARSAETPLCRARFTQMAHEYLLATSLMPKELSPLNRPPGPTPKPESIMPVSALARQRPS